MLDRIGRIKQKYSKVARHFDIKVSRAASGNNAAAVKWSYGAKHKQADKHTGSYVLRTSHGEWNDEKIVRTYWQLTDILGNWKRVTTTVKVEDDRTIINRQDERPTDEQVKLACAAGTKIQLHQVRSWGCANHKINANVVVCTIRKYLMYMNSQQLTRH